jgi:hypothetical protein
MISYTQLVKTAKWIDNGTYAIFNNTKEFMLTINKDFICTPTYNPKLREKDGIDGSNSSTARTFFARRISLLA